ncbi:MAG: peptidase domain-containing ABC transporter [Spirosomataceae bacterium]
MKDYSIKQVLKHFCDFFKIEYQGGSKLQTHKHRYDLEDFIHQIEVKGEQLGLLFIQNRIDRKNFDKILEDNDFPILYFTEINGQVFPVISGTDFKKRKHYNLLFADTEFEEELRDVPEPFEIDGKIQILTAFPLNSISRDSREEAAEHHLTPVQRLIRMLNAERKDIIAIYVYAILIGVIGLAMPLGIQAIIGLVSGGLVFSSVYLLISLVIVALVISGVMQIMQITLVEYLQERLFAKAAFEFTYRIPRIKAESLLKYYPPELMNRFFDILTVQKSLPKFLIDITAALIQIIFGMILLAAYHPLFIAFAVFTFILVFGIIRVFSPRSLDASITKSKYKYKIAQWLQDMARTLYAFKVSGNTNLPMQKMEKHVNGYLKYRKKYFNTLLILFYNAVFFKALVTGGLLVLGTYLVIDRQITLGQFVASEIVIVLVVGAVEKILLTMDSVFDLLTAVDKLGHITDLPLDREFGAVSHLKLSDEALNVSVKNLKYKFKDANRYILDDISFEFKPHESICLTGSNGSGKETLLNVLAGILTSYEGYIAYNGISLRDIELKHLHESVERNISSDGIFDGTLVENITMARPRVRISDVYWVLEKLNLADTIGKLQDGLNTQMVSGGRRFSTSFASKITLARCLVNKPKFLLLSNFFEHFDKNEKLRLMAFLTDKSSPWTLLTVSNDPVVMASCDKVLVMDKGKIVMTGSYEELNKTQDFHKFVN